MERTEIYLDNSATTRVYPEVASLMCKIMTEDYGNPSSMHSKGVEAEKYVLDAYRQVAEVLKVKEKEIVFTSGGTESDNLALIGAAMANKRAGMHIITTKVEHPAILNTVAYLKDEGFEIDYLSVDKTGRISIDELKSKLRKDTIIVSIMHTNNEVGSLMPLEEAGKLIKAVNPSCLFHVDAVQGFGKAVMPIKSACIDMLSISGHKIHGPKGIGILYVNEKVKIKPISYGGGQQKGLRNGTLNAPGIAGIGLAAKMINENLSEKREKLYELKSFFLQEISKVDKVSVNGCLKDECGNFLVKETAPHIINISVKGLRSEVMLHALEEKGIYVSAGSACSSHSKKESSTLKAMGASAEETDGALRISMSEFTTREELETLIVELKAVIDKYGRFIRK
ncbi:MAG: cysteine desulfurase [Lachnospiraceae bacterium]|nr:cysteine desulfurase [Lachnospiraceae bacterium]